MSYPVMNATQITVPSKAGAQGDSIENYVLDRVSGDVEKNMGQVVENALAGASVPVAALIVLDGGQQIRRAYIAALGDLGEDVNHGTQATRRAEVVGLVGTTIGTPGDFETVWLELEDPGSTLKGKQWVVPGLTQTAAISGTSGLEALDNLFVPSRRSYTLAALIAKLEDLALTNSTVAVFVNQAWPEVLVAYQPTGGEFDAAAVASLMNPVAAQINGVFVSESSESNPSFGFESGGGF